MGQLYWITEYGKVLLVYGFVSYLWPLVVFHRHLKGRNAAYRWGFCLMISVLLINTGVLVLGLVHLLYSWLVAVLYYAVFLIQLFRWRGRRPQIFDDLRKLSVHTIGTRRLFSNWRRRIRASIREALFAFWQRTEGRRIEFLMLTALLIYGTVYFGLVAFDTHTFGSGDQYVHHQWIYGLQEGKIFVKGIYPAAMHCLIYVMHVVSGVRVYSCVLFLAAVYIHTILLAACLLMREVFRWRYSPLFALCLFLTLDQLNVNAIYGMSRLGWTLPMEFGMNAEFLAAAFLLRFLKRVKRGFRLKREPGRFGLWRAILKDEDLLVFLMAVAVTLAVHFYATIMAFFLCLGVCAALPWQLLKRGSFGPLVLSGLLAFLIAVLPMAAAYAEGYPLQGSLGWAVGVIKRSDTKESAAASPTPAASATSGQDADALTDESGDTTSAQSEAGADLLEPDAGEEATAVPLEQSGQMQGLPGKIVDLLRRIPSVMYNNGYCGMFSVTRARWLLIATAFAFATAFPLSLVMRLRFLIKRGTEKEEAARASLTVFDGYLAAVWMSLFLLLLCVTYALKLPMLMEPNRLYTTIQMVMVMLYVIPADYLLWGMGSILPQTPVKLLSAAMLVGLFLFIQSSELFHGFLFSQFTRYNAAVETTNRILDEIPDDTFTVVSTTEELYQVIEYGFHEELLTFVQREQDPSYTLPTPYVFLYIEKKPLHYAHYHFATGPAWLGREKYPRYLPSISSQCPAVRAGEIDEESAEKGIRYGAKLSDTATNLEGRTILESKAYRWYQRFSSVYPNESRVYYEDEDFLCFCFVQNVNSLYSLGAVAEGPA